MTDIPEIAAREETLAGMLAGKSDLVSAAEAETGLQAAFAHLQGGPVGPRTLGFGIIRAGEQVDGQAFVVAVTDGVRSAEISAFLTGTLVATLNARGEDPSAHVIERLTSATGSLPNDGHRYENILLNHPHSFGV